MSSLTGTPTLIRLALRRDRIILPIWIYAYLIIAYANPASIHKLYPTQAALDAAANGIGNNPALVALAGPAVDLNSLGGFSAWKFVLFAALGAGLMSILTVTRHTRAEEETGRLELLGAGILGRQAPLTAAVTVASIANLALGIVTALGATLGGTPLTGSIAYGASLTAAGWAFTGIAALTTQLSQSARTCNGIAIAVLGTSYVLRVIGDTAGPHGPGWLTWTNPIGWTLNLHPYSDPRWWIIATALATTVAFTALGYTITNHRDFASGLLADRPGPTTATPRLRTPLALATRLHLGLFTAWAIGFALAGFALGSITNSIGAIINSSPQVAKALTQLGGQTGLTNAYLAAILSLTGMIAAIYTVQATLRLRGEETSGRIEPLLATHVSRTRLAASHLTYALGGTALLLAIVGVTTGLGAGLTTHNLASQLGNDLTAALLQTPAAWTLAGIAIAVIGLLPGYSGLAWAAIAIVILIGELGPILRLNHWAMDISPFTHLPKLPGGTITATPIIWLVAIAAALTATGLAAFRRRDIG
jgi:ABC-2 type transport system permease protein